MKLRLIKLRDFLVDSFWFLPTLMAFLAVVAALGSVALDHAIGSKWVQDIGWVWSGGADGARGVLSTVAGSVMTVISIVFSLTISVLAQTSSHYGPRVLRNFTSDRAVQFTLGTFIATFIYCLLVLRTIRSVEELSFIPYLSVNIGVALALASLAVLIFFIHYVSQSIQAEILIADVGQDFQSALPLLLPDHSAQEDHHKEDDTNEDGTKEDHWKHALAIASQQNGYLQRLDEAQLMRLAKRYDLQLRLEKRPGEFISRGAPLLWALPPSRVTNKTQSDLCRCFVIGSHRTPHQDALYSLQQLVEIAAHALSPGINEPYTALTSIDWIGASLHSAVNRQFPSPLRYDETGKLRILARTLSFDEMVHTSLDSIRRYGAGYPDVLAALLEVIRSLAPDLTSDTNREALRHQTQLIGEDTTQIENESDRKRVRQHVQETLHALGKSDSK